MLRTTLGLLSAAQVWTCFNKPLCVCIGYCFCGGLVWGSYDMATTFGGLSGFPQNPQTLAQEVSERIVISWLLFVSVFVFALPFSEARRVCVEGW